MKYVLFTLLALIISFGVRAEDCPYSIKDASVMLSLPGETNLKITSSAMCNQKPFFADRFFDGEVEIWKKGKLVGKFYSRKIAYDLKTFRLVLQSAVMIESDLAKNSKIKDATLVVVDLEKGKLSSNKGMLRF